MEIEIRIFGKKEEVAPLLAFLGGTELGVVVETLPPAPKAAITAGPGGPLDTSGAAGGGAGDDVGGAGGGEGAGGGGGGALSDVELDGDYYPWDERINTPQRTKLVKGNTWKLIRGIETKAPGLVETVRAELLAAGFGVEPEGDSLPPGPGNDGDATPPGPKDDAPTLSFPQIIAAITNKVQAGEVTDDDVDRELQALGIVGGPPMIGTREELFPQVIEALGLC